WIWYLSDDRVMTSGYQVKLNQLEYRLRGRPQSVSVWAISTDIQNGRADAASALEKFAARMSIAGLQL
ncbi:MAG: exosortase-associated EpsI family protein, partial [Candidatus Korobacteraceae bacterium]